MSHYVRCAECKKLMDSDDAHDTFREEDGELRYWCENCCPWCARMDAAETDAADRQFDAEDGT